MELFQDYWANLIAALVSFAILALVIERSLYQIFDSKLWRWFERKLDEQVGGDFLDLKPWISVGVSLLVVFQLHLDLISTIFKTAESTSTTLILTGLFVAGGSTGVYKFFKRARRLKEFALEKESQK